jgi:hypothetical protein
MNHLREQQGGKLLRTGFINPFRSGRNGEPIGMSSFYQISARDGVEMEKA